MIRSSHRKKRSQRLRRLRPVLARKFYAVARDDLFGPDRAWSGQQKTPYRYNFYCSAFDFNLIGFAAGNDRAGVDV